MIIFIDTREQLPIVWPMTHRTRLIVGDYTTDKLFNVFHIERKSGQDLYGSIIQRHRKFMDMLIKGHQKGIKLAIYVECPRQHFIDLKFGRGNERNMKPETLGKIVTTIEKRLMERYGFDIVWCKDREQLKKKIFNRLKKETYIYEYNQ